MIQPMTLPPLPAAPGADTPSDEGRYLAVLARDARFDGHFFTAVTSTGIYCRPVCAVRAPRRENCRFFALAAQAEHAGFRPCLRCRPELAPQALVWSVQDASSILVQQAVRLLALAHQHLGAGLTGFEVMGRFALQLVDKHMPQLRVPFIDQPEVQWAVLLENSDSESEQHARERFEALLETAFEAGCVQDAVVAESITQAQQLWHIRENIPLAQAEEGLNIKHDISVPISRIPAFVEYADALLQREIPGVRLVNFGHLGDGNLHYNVQAPEGGDAKAFLRDQEDQVNHLVYEAVAQFGGSFSAEHGVGALKTDKLERYQSPVALSMMRAIKQALDPQNLMNPGRVLGG